MSTLVESSEPASRLQPTRWGTPSGILLPALIYLAVLVAYLPSLDGTFLWDDDDNITESVPLRSLDGLRRIWFEPGATQQYFPVLHTMWWFEYRAWGDDPRGYRVVNLLLHATAAALLARVLLRLGIPGAWLAAALFALHPLCAESVAWITEGKNTLSLCFFLTSLLWYLRAERIGDASPGAVESDPHEPLPRRVGFYFAALAAFAAAVLSKTNAVTLPAFLLVLFAWRNGRLTKRDWLGVAPMFVFGAVAAAIVVYVERTLLGARGAEFDWPWSERVLVAGRALWFYLGRLLWPYPLTFIYPRWHIDPAEIEQWLYPLSAVALPGVLWLLRKRIGGGPLVATLYFGGTLMPQLGLMPLYGQLFSYVADHWCYLSAPGPIVLVAAYLTIAAQRMTAGAAAAGETHVARSRVGTIAAVLLIAVLGALTHAQAKIYRDQESLWTDTLAKNPECWLAHHNLAVVRLDEERYVEAEAGIARALELHPQFKEAYTNQGLVAEKLGRLDDARRCYERALQIDPRHPYAHANLAKLLITTGKPAAAIEHLQAALEKKPDLPEARATLGLVLAATGRAADGLRILEEAVRRNPADVAALVNLGTVLAQQGKLVEAQAYFLQAVDVKPDSAPAQAALGGVLLAEGHTAAAVDALLQAVELDPRQTSAEFNLGNALVRMQRLTEAVAAYERAIHLDADHVPSRLNLAATLLRIGDRRGAEAQLREVLQRRPDEPNATKMLAALMQPTKSP